MVSRWARQCFLGCVIIGLQARDVQLRPFGAISKKSPQPPPGFSPTPSPM
jgi:hypothetical protein